MALPGLPRGLMLVCGIDAACVLLLWGLGRWTFRRREDMVTEDSARNQTLLRVRRLYWDRFWRLNLWAMALLNLFLILATAPRLLSWASALALPSCWWQRRSGWSSPSAGHRPR